MTGTRWTLARLGLLVTASADFRQAGAEATLELLSVDGTQAAVDEFQASHPEVAGSLRLADFEKLESWPTSVGLDKGATLPVHVFVDPAGKVICSRTGAISESDVPRVKRLLRVLDKVTTATTAVAISESLKLPFEERRAGD